MYTYHKDRHGTYIIERDGVYVGMTYTEVYANKLVISLNKKLEMHNGH